MELFQSAPILHWNVHSLAPYTATLHTYYITKILPTSPNSSDLKMSTEGGEKKKKTTTLQRKANIWNGNVTWLKESKQQGQDPIFQNQPACQSYIPRAGVQID